MGSGASHESATAAVAAGVSEDDIAAHLAALDKKPCTVYYSPFSNHSMGAAMTATACGCDLGLQLAFCQAFSGERKSRIATAVIEYSRCRSPKLGERAQSKTRAGWNNASGLGH